MRRFVSAIYKLSQTLLNSFKKNMSGVSRRLFITENNLDFYQIMSISQHPDGSIYFSWPEFDKTTWHFSKNLEGNILSLEAKLPKDGKFTIHGSGMTGFREHNGQYDKTVVFHGNQLKDTNNNKAGIRHLLTAQIPNPNFIPTSKFNNRKTDFHISASNIVPACLIFFAIPKQNFSLSMQISFHKDYIVYSKEGTNISYLGSFIIELDSHILICAAYFTKNMFWPSYMHILYDNGYKIPVILGVGERQYNAELREPKYNIFENNKITIEF